MDILSWPIHTYDADATQLNSTQLLSKHRVVCAKQRDVTVLTAQLSRVELCRICESTIRLNFLADRTLVTVELLSWLSSVCPSVRL